MIFWAELCSEAIRCCTSFFSFRKQKLQSYHVVHFQSSSSKTMGSVSAPCGAAIELGSNLHHSSASETQQKEKHEPLKARSHPSGTTVQMPMKSPCSCSNVLSSFRPWQASAAVSHRESFLNPMRVSCPVSLRPPGSHQDRGQAELALFFPITQYQHHWGKCTHYLPRLG